MRIDEEGEEIGESNYSLDDIMSASSFDDFLTNDSKRNKIVKNFLNNKFSDKKKDEEDDRESENETDFDEEDDEFGEDDINADEEDFDVDIKKIYGNSFEEKAEENADEEAEEGKETENETVVDGRRDRIRNITDFVESDERGKDLIDDEDLDTSYSDDFYQVEDGDFLDEDDPSLIYSSSSDSVVFDELNDGEDSSESSDESEDNLPKEKGDFKPIESRKPGKLFKNRIIYVIAAFFAALILTMAYMTNKKDKEENENDVSEEYLNVDGYSPDFGNYRERAYKGEDNADAIEKINKILSPEGKEDFVDERKEVNNVKPKQSDYVPSGPKVEVVNDGMDDRMAEKYDSSLRYGGEGFGYTLRQDNASLPPILGGSESGSRDLTREDYMNNVASIRDSLSSSYDARNKTANEGGNSSRVFSDGKYERGNGGNVSVSSIPDYSLYPGTVIHAVMINGINTDYPGNITARVLNNVYDSRTGKHLLIPSGSILRGSYSSASIGVSRIQIAWQTLVMNRDGRDYIIELGSMVGVDSSGYSGIKGTLNDHTFQYLRAAGISSMFTFLNANIFEVTNAQKNKTLQDMISESQNVGNQLADKILDRALDIEPTVKVKPGTKVSVDVDRVLTLVPFERDMPVEKYIRK